MAGIRSDEVSLTVLNDGYDSDDSDREHGYGSDTDSDEVVVVPAAPPAPPAPPERQHVMTRLQRMQTNFNAAVDHSRTSCSSISAGVVTGLLTAGAASAAILHFVSWNTVKDNASDMLSIDQGLKHGWDDRALGAGYTLLELLAILYPSVLVGQGTAVLRSYFSPEERERRAQEDFREGLSTMLADSGLHESDYADLNAFFETEKNKNIIQKNEENGKKTYLNNYLEYSDPTIKIISSDTVGLDNIESKDDLETLQQGRKYLLVWDPLITSTIPEKSATRPELFLIPANDELIEWLSEKMTEKGAYFSPPTKDEIDAIFNYQSVSDKIPTITGFAHLMRQRQPADEEIKGEEPDDPVSLLTNASGTQTQNNSRKAV